MAPSMVPAPPMSYSFSVPLGGLSERPPVLYAFADEKEVIVARGIFGT